MARSRSEVMELILAEVRRCWPDGIHPVALQARVSDPLSTDALIGLLDEGRVILCGGMIALSDAQRELDGMKASIRRPHADYERHVESLRRDVMGIGVESYKPGGIDSFALGLHAASWIALYGDSQAHALNVVRLSVGDTKINVAVLGAHGDGWMLCSPATLMLPVNRLGVAASGEARIVDEDLAKLRATKAEG